MKHYDVNFEGQTIGEDVELHPEEKYVQIESQPMPKRTPMTIIKDFERVNILQSLSPITWSYNHILFFKLTSTEMHILVFHVFL